mmetsp:Transcript_11710/g.32962  ORF Transcript_11710/g.32962 Transcript_11710/m.32962 type:complete len:204 (-) Transcript_11710:71-682(-)
MTLDRRPLLRSELGGGDGRGVVRLENVPHHAAGRYVIDTAEVPPVHLELQVAAEAHDVQPFPVLREPLPHVYDPPTHVVAAIAERREDRLEGSAHGEFRLDALLPRTARATVHGHEPGHIFEEKGLGPARHQQSHKLQVQLAAGIISSALRPSTAKWLAREPACQHVNVREPICINRSDVSHQTIIRGPKVGHICFPRGAVDL